MPVQQGDTIFYRGTFYRIIDVRPPVLNKQKEVTHYRYQGSTLAGAVFQLDIEVDEVVPTYPSYPSNRL